VTGILLGWEEFSISGVDDSQRMREKIGVLLIIEE